MICKFPVSKDNEYDTILKTLKVRRFSMIRIFATLVSIICFVCLSCADDGASPPSQSDISDQSSGNQETTDDESNAGNPGDIPEGFNSERLFATLETLASDEMKGRDEGTPESAAARKLIIEQLQSCGVPPLEDQSYEQEVEGSSCINLLAKVDGSDPTLTHRNVLLSAHYDHIGLSGDYIYNGAYDNASAVASVLETACVFSQNPPSRSVVFGFWDCEEPPTFLTEKMGSEFFAENPPISLDTIDVSIVLDLWGSALWPGFNGLFVLGAEASDVVKETLFRLPSERNNLSINIMSLHLIEKQPMGHQSWSDYNGFRNRGVPFLFLSDGQNKHYHKPTDTMDNIVDNKLIAESEYLILLVNALGNNQVTPTWQGNPHLGAHDLDGLVEFGKVVLGETDIPSIQEGLKIGPNSVNKLKNDVNALLNLQTKSSIDFAEPQLQVMRRFTQRLMCLAGSTYPELLCTAL